MTMHMLDNPEHFKKYDKHKVLESIIALPKQCQQAWAETTQIKFPASYHKVKNVVIAGMGGSTLGGYMIKSIYEKELRVPMEVVNHYNLPEYVNRDTLVIVASYSGGTEETLAAAQEAKKRGGKIMGITTGGPLGKWLAAHKVPRYVFVPTHNPSGQPRLGTGYTMIGMLAMLCSAGVFGSRRSLAGDIARSLKSCDYNRLFGSFAPTTKNPAKQMAEKLKNRGVLIFASQHLIGNAHTMANQINESAKQFAVSFPLPEANHHLMEGLTFPKTNSRNLAGLFLESNLYHPRVAKRYPISREVLQKQHIPAYAWAPRGNNRLLQALEALSFGSFLSFYLAMQNNLDPSQIPWVDYFKRKLGA